MLKDPFPYAARDIITNGSGPKIAWGRDILSAPEQAPGFSLRTDAVEYSSNVATDGATQRHSVSTSRSLGANNGRPPAHDNVWRTGKGDKERVSVSASVVIDDHISRSSAVETLVERM